MLIISPLPCDNKITLILHKAGNNTKTTKMNTAETTGSWSERKVKLRQKFASLTENDLMAEDGQTEEMLGRLQLKLGKTKDELRRILAQL